MDLLISTIVFILMVGGISVALRKGIAKAFCRIPLPKWVLFLLAGTIYSILEENINCPPSGCTLIPWTIPLFFAFLIIHLGILKFLKLRNFFIGVLIFGLIGWVVEFLMGSSAQILWSNPLVTALMTLWTLLTYSIIAIVPVTILLED